MVYLLIQTRNQKVLKFDVLLDFREKNGIKILVVCNDEFSMMAVQLLNEFLVSNNEEFKVLLALAALKDEGLMWYKKNMPK